MAVFKTNGRLTEEERMQLAGLFLKSGYCVKMEPVQFDKRLGETVEIKEES